jgi:hypothetical protein
MPCIIICVAFFICDISRFFSPFFQLNILDRILIKFPQKKLPA